jgi:integrase
VATFRLSCTLFSGFWFSKAGIGHVSSHTRRTWLDSVGTPVGVQQKLMRHSDICTTMNIYGDAVTADMREAHQKVVNLALAHAN